MADERLGPAFSIAGWGVWPAEGGSAAPPAALLGPRVRGRASPLTLMFAEVLGQACGARPELLGRVPTVYGSAYGEMERLVQLLASMQDERGEVSPLRFQTSVHNTAAGLISIATRDRAFSTTVAAGTQTLAMAFVEAVSWLAGHGGEIAIVVGDEPSPSAFVPEDERFGALAAAFLIRPEPDAAPPALRCQLLHRPGAASDATGRANHPCAAVIPLVRALRAGPPATVPLDATGVSRYFVDLSCPASKT